MGLRHSGRILCFLALALLTSSALGRSDPYDALLHSDSVFTQRESLLEILDHPQEYVTRVQNDLNAYPHLLRDDPTAAKRVVYLSTLIRDPSFADILANAMALPAVLNDCIYACPLVFSLAISASFGGWTPPTDLDSSLTTAVDLKLDIANISRIKLRVGSLEDVVQGPALETYRKELENKTEKQLIRMAGPTNSSIESRMFAAYRLETLVTASTNRIDLYLLAFNDFEDASGEFRTAVYQSIYRAEVAKAQGK